MNLNTRPKLRARVRLALRAQRCASCSATILRGAWAWREPTAEPKSFRFYCDGGACRTGRIGDAP